MRGNPSQSHRAAHSAAAIQERLERAHDPTYLRDFVYGAIDGAVTTFAVVSGVVGAGLSSGIIVVLGTANLIADGFSMAVGNYLGTKAENQLRDAARREEYRHIELFPEGEEEEVRQIFARKGFSGDELKRIVEVITADRARWVDTMLQDELGLALKGPNPRRAALSTFGAFVLIGIIPISPFLSNSFYQGAYDRPFLWSICFTLIAFFVVGALKSRYVAQHWGVAGFETMLMGGVAAALSYVVGATLRGLVGV